MLLLNQTIGQEECVLDLTGFKNILSPDQKGDEEIDEGGFYGKETPELDYVVE